MTSTARFLFRMELPPHQKGTLIQRSLYLSTIQLQLYQNICRL